MRSVPQSGEHILRLPDLSSSTGSTSTGNTGLIRELVTAIHAVQSVTDRQSTQNGQEGQSGATAARHLMDLSQFGGGERFETWLLGVRSLDVETAMSCGKAIWGLLAALAKGLPTTALPSFSASVIALAARCCDHFRCASSVEASQAPSADRGNASSIAVTLASISERLPEVVSSRAVNFLEGFAVTLKLLASSLSARTPAGAKAAEAWMQVALASGAKGLEYECVSFLKTVEADDSAPLINLAWRLLKSLCLHPSSDTNVVQAILERSAQATCSHLIAAASAGESKPTSTPSVLQLATFHSANFARIARDSPALANIGFPLAKVGAALAPAASSLCESPEKVRELYDQLLGVILERWLDSARKPNGSGSVSSTVANDFANFTTASTAGPFLTRALMLLAGPRSCRDSKGDLEHWGSQDSTLLAVVLNVIESRFHDRGRLGIANMDNLVTLCSIGVPGMRPRLLAWTISADMRLYCLSLSLHSRMPKRMNAKHAFAWAQLLVEGLLAVSDKSTSRLALGRAHCQTASCVTVFLAQVPASTAVAWLQRALAPILSKSNAGEAPPPGVWLLARRLAVGLTGNDAMHLLSDLARRASDDLNTSVNAVSETVPAIQLSALRCLAALTRSGASSEMQMGSNGQALRKLLGKSSLPPALRLEAWATHAQVCLRAGAVDELRVSLRFAVKHLADDASAGARVAAILVQAPLGFLEGASATIEGLCRIQWPLRVAGLSAAGAVRAHSIGTSVPAGDAATVAAAENALAAFTEEYGCSNLEWSQSRQSLQAKRRRLLSEIAALPLEGLGNPEPDVRRLCLAARSRITTWMDSEGAT